MEELICEICGQPAEGYCPVCGKYYCSNHSAMDPAVVDPGIENDAGLVGVLCENCKWIFYDKENGRLDPEKVKQWEEEHGIKLRPGWVIAEAIGAVAVEEAVAKTHRVREFEYEEEEFEFEES